MSRISRILPGRLDIATTRATEFVDVTARLQAEVEKSGLTAGRVFVQSLHTTFVRGATPNHPLELDVDVLQDGRTFAMLSISVRQGDRLCTRALALLHAPDADLHSQ